MEGEGSIVKGEGQLHKQLEEIQINSKGLLLQMLKVVFLPVLTIGLTKHIRIIWKDFLKILKAWFHLVIISWNIKEQNMQKEIRSDFQTSIFQSLMLGESLTILSTHIHLVSHLHGQEYTNDSSLWMRSSYCVWKEASGHVFFHSPWQATTRENTALAEVICTFHQMLGHGRDIRPSSRIWGFNSNSGPVGNAWLPHYEILRKLPFWATLLSYVRWEQ